MSVQKLKMASMGKCSWGTVIQVCTEKCDYLNIIASNFSCASPMSPVWASLLPYLAAFSLIFVVVPFMHVNPFISTPKLRCRPFMAVPLSRLYSDHS
jgi:hypothetical protein